MAQIIKHEFTQGNPCYDPRFANNGGGYDQPYWKFYFDDGAFFTLEDTSCGDFGSRYFAELTRPDGSYASAQWGSMIEKEHRYSEFGASDAEYINATSEFYTFPDVPMCEEDDDE